MNRDDEINAAIVIAEASKLIADDLMHNHGVEFKSFIQELLSKKNEIVKFEVGGKSVVLANQKEIQKFNPVEEALQRLEESPYRRDKRKILEQYNLQDEKAWGTMEKYDIRRRKGHNVLEQHKKVSIEFYPDT